MVMAMPCEPHVVAWIVLLGACRIHGDVEMAECIAKQVLEMEPDNAAGGNMHLCENVENEKKQPGCNWIEVNNEVQCL